MRREWERKQVGKQKQHISCSKPFQDFNASRGKGEFRAEVSLFIEVRVTDACLNIDAKDQCREKLT